MANPSISVPDDVLDKFDDLIIQKKAKGELDRDVSRSEIIAQLMEEWIEEGQAEGNRMATAPAIN